MAKATKCNKDLFDVVRRIGRVSNLTTIEQNDLVESAIKWVGNNCCPMDVFGLEVLKDAMEEVVELPVIDPDDIVSVED